MTVHRAPPWSFSATSRGRRPAFCRSTRGSRTRTSRPPGSRWCSCTRSGSRSSFSVSTSGTSGRARYTNRATPADRTMTGSPAGRLPTFYIVGAMKSGTSALHHALGGHPSVFMSTPKELHFFVEDRNWGRGVTWYAEQFAGANGATAVGEASVTYTQMPFRAGVPERMAELTPDARIVYVVRHPIERMLSHYRFNLGLGRETRPLTAAFERRGNYRAFSQYAMQIRYYYDHFPAERILVLPAERFYSDSENVVRRIWSFLGVDPDCSPVVAPRINATNDMTAPVAAARTLRNVKGADAALKLLPKSARARMKKALPRRGLDEQHVVVPPSLRAQLE